MAQHDYDVQLVAKTKLLEPINTQHFRKKNKQTHKQINKKKLFPNQITWQLIFLSITRLISLFSTTAWLYCIKKFKLIQIKNQKGKLTDTIKKIHILFHY